jgi:uncharacterized protein
MIIDLDELSEDPTRISSEEAVNIQDVLGEGAVVKCRVDVFARKSGETFYFHTRLFAILPTSCHKCLRPTKLTLDTPFDLIVHRGATEKPEIDSDTQEDYVCIPSGEKEFSLDRHIYENLVVNIPMRILCSETCKGLCPVCGANLNEETCSCEPQADPRWEGLRGLKRKLRGS